MAMDNPTTEGRRESAPFLSSVMAVEPAWIDYNGHLNMAYYNVLFDRAIDELWLELGMGPDYRMQRNSSTFSAECHVRYVREIGLEDSVRVSVLVVASDAKRIHTFQEMRHAADGWLSATSENMSLHMDMTARKVAPFPPDIAERLAAVTDAHARIARPEGIGRSIGIPSQTGRRG
jgi:acyl-CoA thioester hydrolase